ncbi:MAG: chemotaxis protein CheA, partial [Myxococcales bacterium]
PADHSIRVDIRRLDEALEQLSALVVTRFKLGRVASELAERGVDTRELNTVIAEHARQMRRLRAAITQARMVPLTDLLQRLPLVVRGLTRDTRKKVNVAIHAGAAEVDKAVADRIFPAIVHLVRNAVDHAIEQPDERRRLGKPEAGQLSIVCDDSSGANLVVTLSDDGRGIDRESVARKLKVPVARDDAELLQQIGTPGLSTREDVTHTSGRGMGMDIVKRTVELLGGTVTLKTERGRGTTFSLRVPVSVTIVDAFSFVAGGQVFVAPVAMVDEILEVDPARVVRAPTPVRNGPEPRLLQRRGEKVPLLDLDAVLQHREDRALAPKALLVTQKQGAIAFGVERMLGQQEVVVRRIDDPLVRVTGITGATDLGDGRATLVLDLVSLGASVLTGMEVAS